jgi:hypothetical protein
MVNVMLTPFDCVDGYNVVVSGSNTIVGQLNIREIWIQPSEDATVQIQCVPEDTSIAPTMLTGMLGFKAGVGIKLDPGPSYNDLFSLDPGEDFVVYVSSAGTVSLLFIYDQS